MTLNKVLRDHDEAYDAHGFRSSFRDWAAERMPDVPDAVAEAALGSGLVDHSQKMTVAARATAEKKAVGQRSYRVATRRQSLRRPNMISMRLRRR